MAIKDNLKQEVIKRQLEFYYTLNKKCHVKIIPTGFKNGKVISEYIEAGNYVLFQDLRFGGKSERLFVDMIHEVKDYEEPVEEVGV